MTYEERLERAKQYNAKMKTQRSTIEETIPAFAAQSMVLANGDAAKTREIAHTMTPTLSLLSARPWSVGMTTNPGELVEAPNKEYVYAYSGKDPMTHANSTFFPGAAGVYYWAIIPKMHEGYRVYPSVSGIIVAVTKDEIWWNSNKTKKYRWNAVSNNACNWYPGQAGVHQWVEVVDEAVS